MESQILKYIGKRNVWEELSRSAETSSMFQKKSIPRKKPTYQRAITMSRLPKLTVRGKCCKQIIESKRQIPAVWVTRKKRKIILIVNASDLKCSLLCFLPQRLLSSTQFLTRKINAKDIFTIQGILCFRLAADIPNKLTLKIRLSSKRTQTLFFFSSPSSTCQH